MKTEQILLVLAIARERSISKASERLSISQPSASNMLKSLENELGFSLFDRTRYGAMPTEAGIEFIGHAESIERSLKAIKRINKPNKRVELKVVAGRSDHIERAFERLCEKYLLGNYAVGLSCQVVNNVQDAMRTMYVGNGDLAVLLCRKSMYEYEARNASAHNLEVKLLRELSITVTCAKENPIISNGSIDYTLLKSAPCFSGISSTSTDSYIPYTMANKFVIGQSTVVMDHSAARYRLLRKTNGYLISAPVPDWVLQQYGLKSLPIEGADQSVYAVYRKDPFKQELINEYIQAYQDLCEDE